MLHLVALNWIYADAGAVARDLTAFLTQIRKDAKTVTAEG